MSHVKLALGVVLCTLLMVPTAASAKPVKQGFGHTYPYASLLCKKAEAGKTPKRLAASTTEIVAACATLRADFTTAQTALKATATTVRQDAAAAVKTLRATCKQARIDKTPATCKAALKAARATVKTLRAQAKTAIKGYHVAVDTARKAFWTTIKALPGATSLKPDTTVPADPSVSLPTDGELASA